MEDYKTLIEIVSELIDRGYALDFSSLENVMYGFQKAHLLDISQEGFLIDEIYCCNGEDNETGMTYVFAISSKKHQFKGIVINALCEENSENSFKVFQKIKTRFFKLFGSKKTDIAH